jgi:hypothetical protein
MAFESRISAAYMGRRETLFGRVCGTGTHFSVRALCEAPPMILTIILDRCHGLLCNSWRGIDSVCMYMFMCTVVHEFRARESREREGSERSVIDRIPLLLLFLLLSSSSPH